MKKSNLKKSCFFASTDLLCHMAVPPTKKLHGSPLRKQRRERGGRKLELRVPTILH